MILAHLRALAKKIYHKCMSKDNNELNTATQVSKNSFLQVGMITYL